MRNLTKNHYLHSRKNEPEMTKIVSVCVKKFKWRLKYLMQLKFNDLILEHISK